MFDDAVYFTSLVICMSLGSCYKKIEDPNTKRNYGAGLGVLTACLICGHYVYHTVFLVWGNIIIIKCCNKRYAYQLSLAYTWVYLLYLHFNFQNATYLIWLHQTIALRVVGLAFEFANANKSSSSNLSGTDLAEPSAAYYEDEFYTFTADSRYLYNVPQLMMYFLKHQCLMMISSGVYTEAGFGVYPAKCQPMPGQGPTARLSFLNVVSSKPEVALDQEYNFTMLKCFDNEKVLLGPRLSDTMRGWNMPTRYWFWSNIYKMPIKANKEMRSAFSFMVWTLWCGPSIQQFISSSTLWVHLHLEKEYTELFGTGGQMKMSWDIGFSIMRALCLIYLTPCIVIMDSQVLLEYYFSIFWAYHVLLVILIISAVVKAKF